MAISVFRISDGDESRDAANVATSFAIKYRVYEAESKNDALDAVYAAAPGSEKGMSLDSIRFDGFREDGIIEATALYQAMRYPSVSPGQSTAGQWNNPNQFSFDCSAGSARIVRSRGQTIYPGEGSTPPDPQGYIGWNGLTGADSQLEGVEIIVPVARMSHTIYRHIDDTTAAFDRKLIQCTGKVNAAGFDDFEAGEVLFLGASYSGEAIANSVVPVTYNFAIQLNEAAGPDGVAKKGWEYVWTIYQERAAAAQNQIALNVLGVYVDRIYAEIDMGILI